MTAAPRAPGESGSPTDAGEPGPAARRVRRTAWRLLAAAALAAVLGASFAGHLRPDMVLDFALLLQMCGLR